MNPTVFIVREVEEECRRSVTVVLEAVVAIAYTHTLTHTHRDTHTVTHRLTPTNTTSFVYRAFTYMWLLKKTMKNTH